MYEWIVDGISSLFVPHGGQKSTSWPRNENDGESAAATADAHRQEKLGRPAKRNYESVHSSDNSKSEHVEIKRPRRDVVASIVRKTVSGVAGFLRLQNPFVTPGENQKAYTGNQVRPMEFLGVDEVPSNGMNTWIRNMELKMEKQGEVGYSGNPQSMVRKHNGAVVFSERSKSRIQRQSLQLIPSRPIPSGSLPSDTEPPSVTSPNRSHKPCLAVEEALKECDRERYRLLVEMVSEKYTKNKPLPFGRVKAPMKPLSLEAHKPTIFSATLDTSNIKPGHIRANPSVSVWRDISSVRKLDLFNKSIKRLESGKGDTQSVGRGTVRVDNAVVQLQERLPSCTTPQTSSEKQELKALGKQALDLDLSAEVAARLNLADCEPAVREVKPQHPAPEMGVRREEFPRLTKEMLQEISRALDQKDPNLVLSSAFKLRITQRDLATLRDGSWLNDEVINFYMNLVMCRSEQGGGRKLYAFSTFFFPKLHGGGHAAVHRWTKAVDLFLYDLIIVPLHLGVHWSLAVIDFKERLVKCYDSMGQRHDDICNLLLLYLKEEHKIKKNKELDISKWAVTSLKSNEIPQQNNGSDCGVFTCIYADYIALGLPLAFAQCHMPYFRRRMIWEILNQRLL